MQEGILPQRRSFTYNESGKKILSQLHNWRGVVLSASEPLDKLDWQESAACRDYDNGLFFGPEQGEHELERQQREAEAKAVCQRCVVIEPCLEFAMDTNQKYGIWGGLNEKERASLKRRRARSRRAS